MNKRAELLGFTLLICACLVDGLIGEMAMVGDKDD